VVEVSGKEPKFDPPKVGVTHLTAKQPGNGSRILARWKIDGPAAV